ncbi:two-component system KDP operon response regulator KdpE [Arthrobacter pigmenti]|uniref:Two-component system KDP operon response regulator KdpE n=1 Tax=Arthrobacter pigmenti TaxID=271432 RepID=A0A846RJ17_9MICC|nr:response regulator [Arthrobacter pigmenti]NJC23223.1 two-component system KDP operon response regulator KdpE [Arthrobacter pigmenti]
MTTVLIVDDEPQLLRALHINLRAHGYRPIPAPDGQAALAAASEHRPDLVVLDLGLPDLDGVDVIRSLRSWTQVPIIVLSARHGSEDKVEALDAGADDYVTKPFGLDELLARLRAAGRRAVVVPEVPTVETGSFTLDLAGRRAVRDGEDVRLTPTEWRIVELLVRNPGKLISQKQLLMDVWGPAYAKELQYLRVYLNQVRRKLEPDPARPRRFITESGMGYRFEP